MLIPHLKTQILAQMLPQQFLFQQSKGYHYDQTIAVTIKVILKWTMPVLLNHIPDQLLKNSQICTFFKGTVRSLKRKAYLQLQWYPPHQWFLKRDLGTTEYSQDTFRGFKKSKLCASFVFFHSHSLIVYFEICHSLHEVNTQWVYYYLKKMDRYFLKFSILIFYMVNINRHNS